MLVKNFQKVQYRHSKRTEAIVFAEPSYVKRMMHTCIGLGIAINFGSYQNIRDFEGGTDLDWQIIVCSFGQFAVWRDV